MSRLLGNQGWEFVELGKLWQAAMFVAFVLWTIIVVRAVRPQWRAGDAWIMPKWLLYAVASITVLFLSAFVAGPETNFVIATAPDSPRRGVMGWLRPGFEARVVDEADNELPAGEAGELVLRADEPFAFAAGYFGKPEKTVEAWRNL